MTYSMTLSGVDGFSDTPAFLPSDLISCSERCRCGPASAWMVIDRCDHQVNVKHLVAMRAQCLDHIRADGDVGHVMTIHDIDMDVVCASGINRADVNTQLGEIGGKDRRCDFNGV